jgi:hypothetical protein
MNVFLSRSCPFAFCRRQLLLSVAASSRRSSALPPRSGLPPSCLTNMISLLRTPLTRSPLASTLSRRTALSQARSASSLVLIEHKLGEINTASLSAITAAQSIGGDVRICSSVVEVEANGGERLELTPTGSFSRRPGCYRSRLSLPVRRATSMASSRGRRGTLPSFVQRGDSRSSFPPALSLSA